MSEIDSLVAKIETKGFRWDVGMIGPNMYEARIWDWPEVIGRVRAHRRCGIYQMLLDAWKDANRTKSEHIA